MKSLKLVALGIILTTFFAGLAVLLIPLPAGSSAWTFYGTVVTSTMVFVSHVGAGILFLANLHGFTARFKVAYSLFVVALVGLSAALLQVPLFTIFGLVNSSPWVTSGGVFLPFITSYTLLYVGIRMFARLFGVKGWPTSIWLMIVVAIVGGTVLALLPHAPWIGHADTQVRATIGLFFVNVTPIIFGAIMAFRAAKRASVAYIVPLQLIGWYATLLIFASGISILFPLFVTNGIELVSGHIASIPQVIGGFLLLWAAVKFSAVYQIENTVVAADDTSADKTIVDTIIFVAGLASSPLAIDESLNNMRSVTANHTPGQQLTQEEHDTLKQVYLEIESYLTTAEPVRRQTKPEVRQLAEHALRERLTTSTFWHEITVG